MFPAAVAPSHILHTVKVEQVLEAMPEEPDAAVLEKHGDSPNEFEQWPPGGP